MGSQIQKVKSSVQVMNFHSLMKIAEAIDNIERVKDYEAEIMHVIANVFNNRNLILDNRINSSFFEKTSSERDINFYITSDYGLCGAFNSSVIKVFENTPRSYRNYMTGKKGIKKLTRKEDVALVMDDLGNIELFTEILDLFFDGEITGVNIIYNKFITQEKNEFVVQQVLPFNMEALDEIDEQIKQSPDYIIECSFTKLLKDLLTLYLKDKVVIAHLSALATENSIRQQITTESLKKIDEDIIKYDLVLKKERRLKKNDELMDMLIKGKAMEKKKAVEKLAKQNKQRKLSR